MVNVEFRDVKIRFKDLKVGEAFMWDDGLYIKTDEIHEEEEDMYWNTLELTGSRKLHEMEDADEVKPVNIDIIVKL